MYILWLNPNSSYKSCLYTSLKNKDEIQYNGKKKNKLKYKYNAVTACLFSLSVQTGLQSNSCSMK